MAFSLSSLPRQLGELLGRIVRDQSVRVINANAPRVVVGLAKTGVLQLPSSNMIPGRPVTSTARPTADLARRVVYKPRLDGKADPGEVVWTWVIYEEDSSRGKDRPVLVVGREDTTLLGLMLSSNSERAFDHNWAYVGSGPWDHEGRPSWVRLDRVLDVPEAGIRREGAILERPRFDKIAHRLVNEYNWR